MIVMILLLSLYFVTLSIRFYVYPKIRHNILQNAAKENTDTDHHAIDMNNIENLPYLIQLQDELIRGKKS